MKITKKQLISMINEEISRFNEGDLEKLPPEHTKWNLSGIYMILDATSKGYSAEEISDEFGMENVGGASRILNLYQQLANGSVNGLSKEANSFLQEQLTVISSLRKELINLSNGETLDNMGQMSIKILALASLVYSSSSLKEHKTLTEKAKSKAQQKFMGMVHAYQKGDLGGDDISDAVKSAADSMSDKSALDFASTKHKNLPDKVEDDSDGGEGISEILSEIIEVFAESFEEVYNGQ